MSVLTKSIISFLVIATIATAALWLLGGKKQECSATIQISAPPEFVFPYLHKSDKLKLWVTGLTEIEPFVYEELKTGDPNEMKTARVTTIKGAEIRYDDEIIRFEQDKLVSVQSSNPQQVQTTICILEPRGLETELVYRVSSANQGFGRILSIIRSTKSQSEIDEEVRRLKQLIEKDYNQ